MKHAATIVFLILMTLVMVTTAIAETTIAPNAILTAEPTEVSNLQTEVCENPTTDPSAIPTKEIATIEPTAAPTEEPLPLAGIKIGIDPGHQAHGNREKEAIAPGSKEKKAKVSSGTSGRYTGVAEYIVNMDVSLQLRDALEAQGAEVYMTHDTVDVDISNQERATMMNELGVDLVLRIHCNGAENKKAEGMGLYIRKTGENSDLCEIAAEALLPRMVEATGAKSTGIHKSDTYTGLNWSTVPSILVEMGYMTNEKEDKLLNDPAYQQKLVEGMVNGIADYVLREDAQE